jgi:paraquat-inducible protein B
VPAIWLVPIIAALLGLWLVIYTYMTEGPEITITLSTAAGIEPGKTKIKALNVELGIVESLELTQDMQRVTVKAKLERFAVPLLRDDTQFWVVRPRVGPGGISGLGTLLSGSYIRLAAGTGSAGRREFVGLDNPPATPAGTPGLKIYLSSNRAGSVSAGDPVLYRGYRVGQVDSADFDAEAQRISYEIFIDKPYDTLISENTRFWNASGIALDASADGIKLEFGSLQTLLVGGVAFDLPEGELPGRPAEDGDQFELFPNQASIEQKVYEHYAEYVVLFPQSVRGLSPGAPVEYRGIKIGTVQRVLIAEWVEADLTRATESIPVLIRLEPGRVGLPDDEDAVANLQETVRQGLLARGLRATLQTGNLLTGSALIAVDYYPEAGSATPGEFAGYPEIPALPSGIGRLQQQIGQLLSKLNALPIEPALQDLDAGLVAVRETLESIQDLTSNPATQAIPASINTTLQELNATLDDLSPDSETGERLNRLLGELNQTMRNIESLTRTLSSKPNAIIFAPPTTEDPEPVKRSSP